MVASRLVYDQTTPGYVQQCSHRGTSGIEPGGASMSASYANLDVTTIRLGMLAHGYRPVPVLRHDARDKAAGKRPTLPRWEQVCASADEVEIRRWTQDQGQQQCTNTGLLCGDLVGLDIDVPDDALAK